ncbi:MAG: AAA family ATPase [Nitrospira sp.]
MIESIEIANVASFGSTPEVLNGLSTFNFIFGANGTGKTTVTRIIAGESTFPTCKVRWKGGTKLETLVYNRDFIEKNFNQSSELKGVFTLGEKNIDTLKKIVTAKDELEKLTKNIEDLSKVLHGGDGVVGKKDELTVLESDLKEKCWAQKQKHDAKLKGAFEGFRNSAEKFRDKVLQEWNSNSATEETLVVLEKQAATVFGPAPTAEMAILSIEADDVIAYETNPILKKCVIGKDEVDIAAMIKKLGNSDWVREGLVFYEMNGMVCPFCQQSTIDSLAKSLNDYFDETFVNDTKAIEELLSNYSTDSGRLQQQIAAITAKPSQFFDVEKLKSEKELLDSRISLNIQRLALKKKEPSRILQLEPIGDTVAKIKGLINAANDLIAQHNKTVTNLAQERSKLTAQVWKYLLEVELKADLATYKSKRDDLNKAITALTGKIELATADKATKAAEIRDLEKQIASIQPTIDGINDILSSFGFQGFSLAKAENGTCYKLVRPDGSDAKATLSEGERTFVTFLYFYHLLKGSNEESGITADRIAVFDDPVSSLDSDILFIVSSLIKGLFDEIRSDSGHIKQVFVLTHNVYFHKEVTFNPNRCNSAMSEETFWIVRKAGFGSKVKKHDSNPIKTSYELLWAEIRKPDPSNLTTQNTLRRILEHYFTVLGRVDRDEICAMFEGKEKFICKTLFSWVNDGSHYAHDDLYVSVDESQVTIYLGVFRKIFEKTGHHAHYKMMMADAYEDMPSVVNMA